eukprot:UC1_evm2s1334
MLHLALCSCQLNVVEAHTLASKHGDPFYYGTGISSSLFGACSEAALDGVAGGGENVKGTKQEPSSELLALLDEAVLEFVESSTPCDASLRAALLRHYAEKWPLPSRVMESFIEGVELLGALEATGYDESLATAANVLARTAPSTCLVPLAHEARDLSRNAWSLFCLEQASRAADNGNGVEAWDALCSVLHRLATVLELKRSILREARYLDSVSGAFNLTWAAQSHLYNQGRLAAARLSMPFIRFLQPFFAATQKLAESLLKAPAPADLAAATLVGCRRQLWALCIRVPPSQHVQSSDFGTCWTWMKVALENSRQVVADTFSDTASGTNSYEEPLAHVMHLADKISGTTFEQTVHPYADARARWWQAPPWKSAKVLGVARMLSAHATNLDASETVRAMRPDRRFVLADIPADALAMRVSTKHRQQVVDGLATVACLGSTRDSVIACVGQQLCGELLEENDASVATIKERDTQRLLEALRLLPEAPVPDAADRDHRYDAALSVKLWPLFDYFSGLCESEIVTRLLEYDLRAVASIMTKKECHKDEEMVHATDLPFSLRAEMEEFITNMSRTGRSRSATDLGAYQQLLWRLEQATVPPSSGPNGTDSSSSSSSSSYHDQLPATSTCLPHLMTRYFAHLFFDATDILDPETAQAFGALKMCDTNTEFGGKEIEITVVPEEHIDARGSGPHRRQQAVVVPMALHLLRLSDVPLDAWSAKLDQLNTARTLLQEAYPRLHALNALKTQVDMALAVLSRLVVAIIGPDLSANLGPALHHEFDEFVAQLPRDCKANGRTDSQAAWIPAPFDALEAALSPKADLGDAVCKQLQLALQELATIDFSSTVSDPAMFAVCGKVWVRIGLVAAELARPESNIDAASAVSFELTETAEECRRLKLAVSCRSAVNSFCVGCGNETSIAKKLAERETAVTKARALVERVTFREDPAQYGELFRAAQSFCGSSLDPVRILSLAEDLEKASCGVSEKGYLQMSDQDIATTDQRMREEQLLQRTHDDFCRHMDTTFAAYPDVIRPLTSAVYMVKNGLCLLAHSVETAAGASKGAMFDSALASLCAVPLLQDLAPSLWSAIDPVLQEVAVSENTCHTRPHFLHAALLRIRNAAHQAQSTHDTVLQLLPRVLQAYLDEWERLAAERAAKEAEDAQTFKYRDRKHAIETAEEEAERDLRRLFPTFFHVFEDLDDGPESYVVKDEQAQQESNERAADAERDRIQLDARATAELCHNHAAIMRALEASSVNFSSSGSGSSVSGSGIAGVSSNTSRNSASTYTGCEEGIVDADRIELIRAGMRAVGETVTLMNGNLPSLDAKLLPTALVLMQNGCKAFDLGRDARSSDAKPPRQTATGGSLGYTVAYDFYHDGHPAEAFLARRVLLQAQACAQELLCEWPDHPTLAQIIAVADRVLGFSVESPLPKLLTGLDMLLQKCNIWEATAASHVSVAPIIAAITRLIIRWRKLELATWPELFAVVVSDFESRAAAKWFDIYKLLTGHIDAADGIPRAEAVQDSMDEAADDTNMSSPATTDATNLPARIMLEGLEAMMQSSCLGEFKARLGLLQAFQIHSALLARSPEAAPHLAELARGLQNLHSFYKQFAPNVAVAIAQEQRILQREVKNFVKLARWKDTNYASVKEAADKTHRKLHKFVKKFRDILEQPVGPTLAEVATGLEFLDSAYAMRVMQEPFEMLPLRNAANFLLDPRSAEIACHFLAAVVDSSAYATVAATVPSEATSGYTLAELPPQRVFTRMRNILSRKIYNTVRADGIAAVDEFAAGIIGRIQWLQEWDKQAVEDMREQLEKDKEATAALPPGVKPKDKTDKDKKKATKRKHGKLMKQASLADLFKRLAKLGLSYRRPIDKLCSVNDMLFAPSAVPLDNVSADATNNVMGDINTLFGRCNEYYYRILARASAFEQAATTPAKDVNPSDAERCIGFGRHMLQVVYVQRKFMADYSAELEEVASTATVMNRLVVASTAAANSELKVEEDAQEDAVYRSESCCPPSQIIFSTAAKAVLSGFERARVVVEDCRLLLRAAEMLDEELRVAMDNSIHGCLELAAAGAAAAVTLDGLAFYTQDDMVALNDLLLRSNELRNALTSLLAEAADGVPFLDAALSAAINAAKEALPKSLDDAASEAVYALSQDGDAQNDLRDLLIAHGCLMSRLMLGPQALARRSVTIASAATTTAPSGTTAATSGGEKDSEATPMTGVTTNAGGDDEALPRLPTDESSNGSSLPKNHLFDLHQRLVSDVRRLGLPAVNKAARELFAVYARLTNKRTAADDIQNSSSAALAIAAPIVASLQPVLLQFHLLASRLHYELLAMHKTACKLEYVLLGLFKDLLSKGYCTPPELEAEEESEEDHEGMKLDGVGVGEGAGEKDVSEQIEDEEQVNGTQNEEKAEPPTGDVPEEEDGLEMTNDFDGELYDKDEPGSDEEGQGEEEEGDEPEEQMGQLDSDKAETLDKDMWGGPDKDEEGLDKDANETGGQETGEVESAAKQDSTQPDNKGDDKNQQQEDGQQQQQQAEEQEEGAEGEGEEQGPEINDAYEEGPGPDEEQEEHGDNGGQADSEHKPPPEDLELPDDLNLDGIEGGDQGGEENGGDEPNEPPLGDEGDGTGQGEEEEEESGEFPEVEPQNAPDQLPDDGAEMEPDQPELGDNAEEPEQEGSEVKNDEGEQDPANMDARPDDEPEESQQEKLEEPEGLGDEGGGGAMETGAESGAEEQEEEEEEREEEETVPTDEEDKQGAQGEANSGDEGETGDPQQEQKAPTTGPEPMDDVSSGQPQGPDEDAGGGDMDVTAGEASASVMDDVGATISNSAAAAEESQTNTGGTQGDDTAAAVRSAVQGAERRETTPAQHDNHDRYEHSRSANPLRDLGDALKQWRDRLNVTDPDEAAPDRGEEETRPDAPEDAQADAYSFVREGEQGDTQTLGATTEEQEAQRGAMAEEEEEEEAKDEGANGGEDDVLARPEEEAPRAGEVLEAEREDLDQAASAVEFNGSNGDDKEVDEASTAGAGLGLETEKETDEQEQDGGTAPGNDALTGAVAAMAVGADGEEEEVPEELSPEELVAARVAIEEGWRELQAGAAGDEAAAEAALTLWVAIEGVTGHLAQSLCEHLRLILEATKAAKMRGDYRTGKRLNMRKIIPYIASQFRKDKIWLRRTKPSKREYQVMVAIDNSVSMARDKELALEAVCVLTTALTRLEVGELAVVGFGERVDLVHPFEMPFAASAGAGILGRLTFGEEDTRMGMLFSAARDLMAQAAGRASRVNAQVHQLLFVVSDGDNVYKEGPPVVERAFRTLQHDKVLVVFIVVDNPRKNKSVLNQKRATFVGGKAIVEDYIDRFADKNYLILRDIHSLPEQLSDVLRQWFEMVATAH